MGTSPGIIMNRTFWIIALISFINSLSFTILIPTIYLYGRQFGLNPFQTSLLFSIYSIAQFLATPVIGKLSDRWGRKPLLILSLAGTVVGNVVAGTTTSAAILFLARFTDGITGGNNSVAQAVISDVTTPQDRARGFGFFTAAFALGFILGPVVSLAAQSISLGASFVAAGLVAAVALVVTIFFLPETLTTKAAGAENIFDLGLGNLVRGIAIPRVGVLLLLNFFTGTTFSIFTFAFQPYFLHVLNQTSQSLTLMFVLFGTMGVLMQVQGIKLLTRWLDPAGIMYLGLLMRSLTFMMMPIWPNVGYFVLVGTVFSMFNSLVQPMLSTLLSLNAQPQDQGMVMGLNSSYLSVANGVGPLIAGAMIHDSQPLTYSYSLYLSGGLTFVLFLAALVTRSQYAAKVES